MTPARHAARGPIRIIESARGTLARLALAAALAVAIAGASAGEPISSDGTRSNRPLSAAPGNPERGRAIVLERLVSGCVLCHEVPGAEGPFGNLGPSLAGVGTRFTADQLRLRMIDSSVLNPDSIMPPYYRTDHLSRVAAAYRNKPILSAEQIEDVVAYLQTLR